MAQINRVVFVEEHGNERAVMAKAIFDELNKNPDIRSEAKGIVVLFPEPMNQKVEAILTSNGQSLEGFLSSELTIDDFAEDTVVLTMEANQRDRLRKKYPEVSNLQLLTDITGDELEIMDPCGGTLQSYGLCYESLVLVIRKLVLFLSSAGGSKNDREDEA